jgi:hypothetical protein
VVSVFLHFEVREPHLAFREIKQARSVGNYGETL